MYAQENYTDKMGNGPFEIKQIGCFVTAFSNILEKFGEEANPSLLNIFFSEHNIYMPDPLDGVGVKDDLGWGSITAYDSKMLVSATGSNSWPTSNNAIVEFRFNEGGHEVSHFCAVASTLNKTIIDSWDGQVKEPGKYGQPVAWASYVHNVPQPVPVPHPASAPATQIGPVNYDGNSITIQDGWGLSKAAAAVGYPDAGSETRWAAIAALNGSGNWQAFNDSLKPGQRIVVGKWQIAPVVAPPPLPANAGIAIHIVTVQPGWGLERIAAAAGRADAAQPACWQVIASANGSNNWQAFNKALRAGQQVKVPLQGGHGEGEPTSDLIMDASSVGTYTSIKAYDVVDLNNPDAEHKPLPAGKVVAIAGSFTYKGKPYYRPQFAVADNSWYGIPPDVFDKKTFRDKLIIAAASLLGLDKRHKDRKAQKKASKV